MALGIRKANSNCYRFSCPLCKAKPHNFCESIIEGNYMENVVHGERYILAEKKFGIFGA